MRIKPSLVPLSLALCCLCAAHAPAQGGKGAPPPPIPPPDVTAPTPTPAARVVEDANAPAGWKRYEFKYGGGDAMSVFFPRVPEESVEKSAGPGGSYVVVHMLSADTRAGVYLASYMELIAAGNIKITPAEREGIFNEFWAHFSEGLQGGLEKMGFQAKLTSSAPRKVTAAGREALEQDFNVGKVKGRYRTVLGERNVYMLIAFGFEEGASGERDAFLESWKLAARR
jgi:hypothetical protein